MKKNDLLILFLVILVASIFLKLTTNVFDINQNNDEKKNETSKQLTEKDEYKIWFDLEDKKHPLGIISSGKGHETNLAVSKKTGMVVVSYEDKNNEGKIRVRFFKNGEWNDLADDKNPKGLISDGKGGNPFAVVRGEDVFVAFMEYDDEYRGRVKKWDSTKKKWLDLEDNYHKNGFLSKFVGHEPVLVFNESGDLYVAYNESAMPKGEIAFDALPMKTRVKKWDGKSWQNISNLKSGFVSNRNATEVTMDFSKKDQSLMIAIESRDDENKIRAMKWNGKYWEDLSDKDSDSGVVGNLVGFSPALTTDEKGNAYLMYTNARSDSENSGFAAVFKWDALKKDWIGLGDERGVLTDRMTVEPAIAVKGENEVYIAYSEFKKDVMMKKRKGKNKQKVYMDRVDVWRVRVKKWNGKHWSNVADDKNVDGYVTHGDGKGDASMSIFDDKLFISVTDRENKNKTRVRFCDLSLIKKYDQKR